MTDPGPAASLLYHVPAPGHAVRELRRRISWANCVMSSCPTRSRWSKP